MEQEILKELGGKLKYLIRKKKSFQDICEATGLKDYELYGVVQLLKQQGELIDVVNGELVILKTPPKTSDIYTVPTISEHLKLLLISDTHLCNKSDRLDILRYLYDKAEKQGVKHVLHSGDFTDGLSNRPEQIYELKEPSYEGQVQYCVDKYPRFSGKTYVIQGNHDDWWFKRCGSEIVKAIAQQRDDIIYLGADVADLHIGKLKCRLFHGSGGSSYAVSYKIQKYLDSIPLEERPDILQTGHIHRAFYMHNVSTHCFQTASLEDPTPYSRSMGFPNDLSCWWVDVDFDNKGNPVMIQPQLETFPTKRLVKSRYKG